MPETCDIGFVSAADLRRIHPVLPVPRHQQDPQAEAQVLQAVLEHPRTVHGDHGRPYVRHVRRQRVATWINTSFTCIDPDD